MYLKYTTEKKGRYNVSHTQTKERDSPQFIKRIQYTYNKMHHRPMYLYALFILGLPVYIFTFIFYLFRKKDDTYAKLKKELEDELHDSEYSRQMLEEFKKQIRDKKAFFNETIDEQEINTLARSWTDEQINQEIAQRVDEQLKILGKEKQTYFRFMYHLLGKPLFVYLTLIPGFLMYGLIYIYSNPFVKYIFDRLLMTVFVIMGVIIFVFTVLYISPFDPAANILGETATKEQIAKFNTIHGLDKSYILQLFDSIKGIFTFNLGLSFEGNEDVAESIMNRFPITMKLAVISLVMAMIIAIPIGIISATMPNSFLDYSFMFIALIGLSIPNFWQGLIFILMFAIKLQWLPATFNPANALSMIMPIIVLGTALTASVARMTRSSMLEIIHEDYMMTAKSKGLSNRQVLWKHAIRNAMIPIITVIGLLFAGMLGGAAVTEKVFNISGIGSYIVDKQFIPDIPSIMAGVVYVAITISLVNVIIDIMYAFFDPRIRSKMKEY